MCLKDVDFKDNDSIVKMEFKYSGDPQVCFSAVMEVRLGAQDGKLIAEIEYGVTENWNDYQPMSASLGNITGKNDIFFVFVDVEGAGRFLPNIKEVTLVKGEKYIATPAPEKTPEQTPSPTQEQTIKPTESATAIPAENTAGESGLPASDESDEGLNTVIIIGIAVGIVIIGSVAAILIINNKKS